MDIRGSVALVTGASSGIGRSLAVKLAEAGAKVGVSARSADRLDELVRQLTERGHEALAVPADMTRGEDVDRMVDRVAEHFGRLDILVNNAGAYYYAPAATADMDRIRYTMELNFFGPTRAILRAHPIFARQGRGLIVNISSTAGFRAWPRGGYYAASKHALNALSESLLLELRDENVGVLCVMPGTTNTSLFVNGIDVPEHLRQSPPRDMTPDAVALAILDAIRADRSRLVLTGRGRLVYYLNRLSPALVDRILSRDGDDA